VTLEGDLVSPAILEAAGTSEALPLNFKLDNIQVRNTPHKSALFKCHFFCANFPFFDGAFESIILIMCSWPFERYRSTDDARLAFDLVKQPTTQQ
jgi:hypothetical protein